MDEAAGGGTSGTGGTGGTDGAGVIVGAEGAGRTIGTGATRRNSGLVELEQEAYFQVLVFGGLAVVNARHLRAPCVSTDATSAGDKGAQNCPLNARFVSALCPRCARSTSGLCPLCVRSVSTLRPLRILPRGNASCRTMPALCAATKRERGLGCCKPAVGRSLCSSSVLRSVHLQQRAQ